MGRVDESEDLCKPWEGPGVKDFVTDHLCHVNLVGELMCVLPNVC